MLDMPMGIEVAENYGSELKDVEWNNSIESILKGSGNWIGFDIAPEHTGIFTWDDESITYKTYGFKLDSSIKSSDPLYYAKVRLFFKDWYRHHFSGMYFEHVCVEGVYGGENYNTTEQLINLNTVFDELLLDGTVSYGELLRVKPTKWLSGCRYITQVKGGYSTKVTVQMILESIGYEFVLENKDKSEKEKLSIFYEDICDATGLCLGIRMLQKNDIKLCDSSSVALSQIRVHYLESLDNMYELNGGFAYDVCTYEVIFRSRNIEKEIKRLVTEDKNTLYYSCVNTSSLGQYGIKQKFRFYDKGFGYLVFYHKDLAR